MLATASFASQPWDKPFAGSPAEIVRAATDVLAKDAEVAVLLDDHRFVIEKDGRIASTYRRVYKILTASALDDWASLEQQWEPWHEVRPELRARVLSADGTEHWLDPKTIADAPAIQFDNTIFSDAQVLRAPLPAAAEGSVVEYEIVRRDSAPLFAAGVARALRADPTLPLERFHVSIDAPKEIELRTGSSLLPSTAIKQTDSKTGTHVEVELLRREPNKDFEFSTPSDQPQSPEFRFSTGASWQTIATAYSRLISGRFTDSRSVLTALGIKESERYGSAREAAEKLTPMLHRQIRYTGVEFADAAIIPNPLQEIVRRHYGDCKDKAALLVALLRASGFDAHLALLLAGQGQDVDPNLPGFGLFNHAIVMVAGKDPLWIDATAEASRVGTLPIDDQGRMALIVSETTTSLIQTPTSSAADNRIVHRIGVRLSESGKGSIHEEFQASGSFEVQMRTLFSGNDHELKTTIDRWGKNSFSGEAVSAFQVSKKHDFSQPFRLEMDVEHSGASITNLQEAAARVSNGLLFENLPYGLITSLGSAASELKPRKHDFVVRAPYHAEVHFKIDPPSGFRARDLPATQNFDTGEARYRMEGKRAEDGSVLLDYSFELTKNRLLPQQVDQLRTHLKQHVADSGQLILFAYQGADLMAVGKTVEAIALARKAAKANPERALPQMRLSQMLAASGAGQEALSTAKQAVDNDPTSARAWLILAYAYEHDSFGRLRTGDWNPGEAEKALRKSIEIDPADLESQGELAILLEHDRAGERYGKNARLAEAATVYRQMLSKSPNPNLTRNLVITLLHMGLYSEAQEKLQEAGPSPLLSDLHLTLAAIIDSSERAILACNDQVAESAARGQMLAHTGAILYQIRQYERGVELLRAAQRLTSDPESLKMIRLYAASQRYDKLLKPETDPAAPVQQFLILAAHTTSGREEMSALISAHSKVDAWQERLDEARSRLGILRANLVLMGGNSESLSDLVMSHSKIDVAQDNKSDLPASSVFVPNTKSDSTVVRRVSSAAANRNNKSVALVTVTSTLTAGLLTFFVAEEGGHWKLLASGDGLEDIGSLALDSLAKGDLGTAQALLDLVKDNALPLSPQDEKGPAIRYLWAGTAPETRNATFAKAAAASLLGTYSGSNQAVVILKQLTARPPLYMERDDLTFALCETLRRAKDWEQLSKVAEPLLSSRSYGQFAFPFIGEALIHLKDWAGLAKAADARLTASSKDHSALQFAAIAAMSRHDFALATEYLKKAKNAPYAAYISDDLLEQWIAILSGKVNDELVDGSESGNIFSAISRGSAYAYTFALAQLRNGRAEDCHKSLLLALTADHTTPSSLAWLVEGALLKTYSLDQSAASAFGHAITSDELGRFAFAQNLLHP